MHVRDLVNWQGVFWQILNLSVGGLFLFLIWGLAGRHLGPEEFGWFNYIYALIAVATLIMDFGLEISLTRLIAQGTRYVPYALLKLKGTITIFMFMCLLVLIFLYPTYWRAILWLSVGAILFSATSFLNGVLRGLERLDIEARIGLIQKSIFLGGTIISFYLLKKKIGALAFSYFLSHLLAFILTLFVFLECNFLFKNTTKIKEIYRESLNLWLTNFLPFLFYRVDIFLLKWLSGSLAVGFYTAGFRFFEGFCLLGTAYRMALFPRLVGTSRHASFWIYLEKSIFLVGGTTLGLAVTFYFFVPFLIKVLYGHSFIPAIPLTRALFLLAPIAITLELISQAFLALNSEKVYIKILVIAGILGSLFELHVVPYCEVWGAFWGSFLRQGAILILSLIWLHRYRKSYV